MNNGLLGVTNSYGLTSDGFGVSLVRPLCSLGGHIQKSFAKFVNHLKSLTATVTHCIMLINFNMIDLTFKSHGTP